MRKLLASFVILFASATVYYAVILEDSAEDANVNRNEKETSLTSSTELSENKTTPETLLTNEAPPQEIEKDSPKINKESNIAQPSGQLASNELKMLKELYSDEGLSDAGADNLFRQANFEDFVYSLEKSQPRSHDIQKQFEDIFYASELTQNSEITMKAFNCDDTICMGALDYNSEESIEQFISDTFHKNKISASLLIQPVSVNGNKEVRLIFNYANPTIIVEKSSS